MRPRPTGSDVRRYDRPGDLALNPYARAPMRYTAVVVAGPTVPDDIFADLRQHLTDRESLKQFRSSAFTGRSAESARPFRETMRKHRRVQSRLWRRVWPDER